MAASDTANQPADIARAIEIDAPAEQVRRALTTPTLVEQWLSPEQATRVTSDYAAGSPITFVGSFHGFDYHDKGEILAAEPNRLLRYSYWAQFSGLPDEPQHYSIMEFKLVPVDGRTRLELTHSNLSTPEIYGHSNFYWPTALGRIRSVAQALGAGSH